MTEYLASWPTVALAVLVAAGASPGAPERAGVRVAAYAAPDQVPDGVWGATGVRLEVDQATAAIEFDCAHGTLEGPLALDRVHRFATTGTFVRERPGPVPVEGVTPEDAQFSGQMDGDQLTLTVRVGDEELGPFTLTHGRQGRLRKCL